ncbi:MAG: fumarate hydratase C-terminal domain-containing protein [Arenicellales bacterium]|nr:fumarate hydratase C-terminal domain-containing protein [Arenicellales bacterium]
MVAVDQRLQQVRFKVPATPEDIATLKIGSIVYLDGVIYTGREGVYNRVIEQGERIPLELPAVSNVNFHCSPAAAIEPDGSYNVGGVTATASFRFSKWMGKWFELSGAKIIIGKGGMSGQDYRDLFVPAGAIYLTTVGYGTGALLGRGIKRVIDVFWAEELGNAQAMWVFEVQNFGPFLVDSDLEGNSLFEQQGQLINANLESLYADLKPPALSRFGETDNRKDELI